MPLPAIRTSRRDSAIRTSRRGDLVPGPDAPPGLDPAPGLETPGPDNPESPAPGVTLTGAIDLGQVAGQTSSVSRELDLGTEPGAVALYRFELPAGGPWTFGAEVSATTVGGQPLRTSLALFDAGGRPIAVAGTSPTGTIESPYLFAGLGAGTYYLGVSGAENQAGSDTGYDPASGASGGPFSPTEGGQFRLLYVAEEAGPTARLVAFGLDHADPLDPAPTGFVLGFSAAVRPSSDREGSRMEGLELIDSEGRSWPIAVSSFDPTHARIGFGFGTRLPAGRYQIRVPAEGGLRDLNDRVPVADGRDPGVLAEFTVAQEGTPRAPRNLGTLFAADLASGTSLGVDLLAGETAEFRFVLPAADSLQIQVRADGGSPAAWLINETLGTIEPLQGGPKGTPSPYRTLPAGVYRLLLAAPSDGAVSVQVQINNKGFGQERLLTNGLGQSSALELRLAAPPETRDFSPTTPSTTPTPSTASDRPATTPRTPTAVDPVGRGETVAARPGNPAPTPAPGASTSPAATSNPPANSVAGRADSRAPASGSNPSSASPPRGPGGLFLSYGGQPIGRAALGTPRISPVGPEYAVGTVAFAADLSPRAGQSVPSNPSLLRDLALDPEGDPGTEGEPAAVPGRRGHDPETSAPLDPMVAAILAEGPIAPPPAPTALNRLAARLVAFVGIGGIATPKEAGPVLLAESGPSGLDETPTAIEAETTEAVDPKSQDQALALDLPTAAIALALGAGTILAFRRARARLRPQPAGLPAGFRASTGRPIRHYRPRILVPASGPKATAFA